MGSRIEQFSDTIFWKCTVKFAFRAPVEQNVKMAEPSMKIEEKIPNNQILDTQPSLAVNEDIPLTKLLVDYELEDEELKDSDYINDINERLEKEDGEILSVQHEEKLLFECENNKNDDGEKIMDIEDVRLNNESVHSLQWLSYTVRIFIYFYVFFNL